MRARTHTRARRIAAQALYQYDLASRGASPLRGLEDLEPFILQSTGDARVRSEARRLLAGVLDGLPEIDARIAAAAEHWRLERIAALDRAVLRLGVWELLQAEDGVPPKVAIHEAIELAKRFSTSQSGAFVNGVLDRVWRDLRGGSTNPGADAPGSGPPPPPGAGGGSGTDAPRSNETCGQDQRC